MYKNKIFNFSEKHINLLTKSTNVTDWVSK